MPEPAAALLATPLARLRGVGPERSAQLARLGVHTIDDLLAHRPHRYEDRRKFLAIAQLKLNEAATVRGKIVAAGIKRWRKGTRGLFECIVEDGSARLHCRWWHAQSWFEEYFAVGREFLVYGKPESLRPRTVDHPETEWVEPGEENFIHFNRIVPVYPLTEGLPQRWLRSLIWRTLEASTPHLIGAHPLATKPIHPSRAQAIRQLHFPDEIGDAETARQRLALDEFVELQLAIQARRQKLQSNARALPCGGNNRLIKPFLASLGFQLTDAQAQVLREIRADMRGRQPMRRLLQGDVGSGKTVVAACSALMALESGFNVALMAPTEILAEQHYRVFRQWFEPLGVAVALRTGSRKTSNTQPPTLNLQRATPTSSILIIGTHALIEDTFQPDKLGFVVIDEQHKFGVAQREALVRKGNYPHLLVMTATPIPRTLGLTLYGDLDSSLIQHLPVGRGNIRTFLRSADGLPKVWAFVKEQLAAGRQAYVVYPRVEETDTFAGIKAVTMEWEALRKEFALHTVGLLHGRLKSDEKDAVMERFRQNRIQVLLATSVIEVGVDVPNATVMVVENADQFGLSQLHQLRGRIGRGAHDSYCVLVARAKTGDARQRLKVMEETNDGFRIAEADLQLRGPGELLGAQQSGLPSFRFGDLRKDIGLIEEARQLVRSSAAGRSA